MSQDENIRKDVFAWCGSALYAAQLFEYELVTLLSCFERFRNPLTTVVQLEDLESKLSKKVTGDLLGELKKRFVISPEFEDLLLGYKGKRNYLAHHFFAKNAENMCSVAGCERMIVELKDIYNSLSEADQIVSKMSENIRIASGIDEDELQRLVELERPKN